MTGYRAKGLRGAVLAAAMVLGGGWLVGSGAEAAPFAPPPAEALAAGNDVTAVHWRGRHFGHHHHHRFGGWGWRRHHHHHWHHRRFF